MVKLATKKLKKLGLQPVLWIYATIRHVIANAMLLIQRNFKHKVDKEIVLEKIYWTCTLRPGWLRRGNKANCQIEGLLVNY